MSQRTEMLRERRRSRIKKGETYDLPAGACKPGYYGTIGIEEHSDGRKHLVIRQRDRREAVRAARQLAKYAKKREVTNVQREQGQDSVELDEGQSGGAVQVQSGQSSGEDVESPRTVEDRQDS